MIMDYDWVRIWKEAVVGFSEWKTY